MNGDADGRGCELDPGRGGRESLGEGSPALDSATCRAEPCRQTYTDISGDVLEFVLTPHLERRSGAHWDRFDAWLGSDFVLTSKRPLLDGARMLLSRGYDPGRLLTIRHRNSAYPSFRPQPIGELVLRTVSESDRDGLQRRPFRGPTPDAVWDLEAGGPVSDEPKRAPAPSPDRDGGRTHQTLDPEVQPQNPGRS